MNSLFFDSAQAFQSKQYRRKLLLSINPDLKSDFGHYLNYEKRINEACSRVKVFHHCLANKRLGDIYPNISGVFDHDSGHYCLYRKSALNNEWLITTEFFKIIQEWISSNVLSDFFDSIIVFVYMSSSKSAAILSCMKWPTNVRLICNSFWDFLSPISDSTDYNLARLQLQTQVILLALSSTYKNILFDHHGLVFDYIPNPPPLASDVQFFDILRVSYATKSVRSQSQIEILMPSLMTMGKGREFTSKFLKSAERAFSNIAFTVRDRKDELRAELSIGNSSRITLLSGDFTDHEIINFYKEADIAILPYSSEVFLFRTSGALVDCLMTSTIPIVFPNTWLSDVCREYDFGIIASSETVEDVIAAVDFAVNNLKAELIRMLGGALKYMQLNSWSALISKVLNSQSSDVPCASPVIRLLRNQTSNQRLLANISETINCAEVSSQDISGSDALVTSNFMTTMLEQLTESSDLDSMKLLLTTVGTRMLLNPKEARNMIMINPKLRKAVERALATLPKEHSYIRRYHQILAKVISSKH